MVSPRKRSYAGRPAGTNAHSTRCRLQRHDTRYLKPPCETSSHGQLRATDQLPEQFVPGPRRPLRHHTRRPRLRSLLRPSGRRIGSRGLRSPEVQYDRDGKPATFFGLNGSASLHGKDLLLTVVNPDTKQPRETTISLSGASAASATGRVLSSSDIHSCNTFANRDAVVPRSTEVWFEAARSRTHFHPRRSPHWQFTWLEFFPEFGLVQAESGLACIFHGDRSSGSCSNWRDGHKDCPGCSQENPAQCGNQQVE